ncbi:hypothetical protein SH449x_000574 [Pirellulaceae bacterium SH449]
MDTNKTDINELISGLLDGHLSVDESRKLDAEIAINPQVESDIEDLSALRSALLRGRPTGKLGSSFASKVVGAARSRAVTMGENAPEWIEPDSYQPSIKSLYPAETRLPWLLPAAAVVATCLFAFLFAKLSATYTLSVQRDELARIDEFNKKQEQENILAVFDPKANVKENLADEEGGALPDALSSPRPDTAALAQANPLGDLEPERANDGAVKLKTPAEQDRLALASGSELDSKNQSTIQDAASAMQDAVGKEATLLADLGKSSAEAPQKLEIDHSTNPLFKASGRLMAVYEISVDSSAREQDILGIYLQKHGLGAVDDLVLNQDEIATVLKSGLVGPASAAGDAQVLVLKGTASMLSEFYDDLMKSYEDFPSMRMNVVMDNAVGLIESQMSSMLVTESSGAVRRLGAKGDSGLVSSFSKGSFQFLDLPIEQRQAANRKPPANDLNPISHVILVVRYPN